MYRSSDNFIRFNTTSPTMTSNSRQKTLKDIVNEMSRTQSSPNQLRNALTSLYEVNPFARDVAKGKARYADRVMPITTQLVISASLGKPDCVENEYPYIPRVDPQYDDNVRSVLESLALVNGGVPHPERYTTEYMHKKRLASLTSGFVPGIASIVGISIGALLQLHYPEVAEKLTTGSFIVLGVASAYYLGARIVNYVKSMKLASRLKNAAESADLFLQQVNEYAFHPETCQPTNPFRQVWRYPY
jgi:hypothetical protein